MNTDVTTTGEHGASAPPAAACPLDQPRTGRIPGLLSLAAIPGAVLANPVFFGLAGGLLAVISLLLSPARCRCLGVLGLAGAAAGSLAGLFLAR